MGPEVAVAALQRALAMGAARGVLVSDDAVRGADTLVTAKVLAAAVRWAGPVDLVVAAVESTDGYTGTLPITLAELLGLPSVTFATSVDTEGGELHAERQTAAGSETVACPLPALVTVTTGVAEPRYPSLKGVMAAKSKPLDRPSLADLGLGADDVRPTQTVTSVADAPAKAGGRVVEAGPDTAAEIADLLAEARVI
jgi:electron transfer flavoprotein beta subunit